MTKWIVSLILACALVWGWKNQAEVRGWLIAGTKSSGHQLLNLSHKLAGEALEGEGATSFGDVYFMREPLDTSANPWTGILRAGTVVRKVGDDNGKALIETGGGFVSVDPEKLTRDDAEITSLKFSMAHTPVSVPPPPPRPPSTVANPEIARIQLEMAQIDQKVLSLGAELASKEKQENEARQMGKPVYGSNSMFLRTEVTRYEKRKAELQVQVQNLPPTLPAAPTR